MANTNDKKRLHLKKYLITGLLIWLPIAASIWVIGYVVSASDGLFRLLPTAWQPEQLFGRKIPGLGVLFTLLLLFFTGLFATNFLGRKVVRLWDQFFGHIPVIKTVYSGVKKVSESLLSDSRQSFKTPILVQFPHQDSWMLAFVSGNVPKAVADSLSPDGAEEYVAVYVPTTPNPTSGYYITVKKSDTRAVDMTVDEALKYIISLGMVMNDEQNIGLTEQLLSDNTDQPNISQQENN